MQQVDFLVIGAGIFGITAALELDRRGASVAVLDPGPLPHPLAASTDISKVIRMEYGVDDDYMAMVDQAIDGWHAWNEAYATTLYHECGYTLLTRRPMAPGGFEYESFMRLQQRGYAPERLDVDEIPRRFPAWKPGTYTDGFTTARAGFAESGRVVMTLVEEARRQGVAIYEGQTAVEIVRTGERVTAVRTREGETFPAGHVIVAAGAWTPYLVPELRPFMKSTGHPVFHLRPPDPALFSPPQFTVFGADTSQTGWYGFPYHPRERVVKVANHGPGRQVHPDLDDRLVYEADIAHLRRWLADTFPPLVDAPIVFTRRCLYNDTLDEHFWIDQHPDVAGLTVAAGGSGHGFKFAPLLGSLIADAAAGSAAPNPWLPKFRWRVLSEEIRGEEMSRYHGGS